MPSPPDDLARKLKQLLGQITREIDPLKYDQLCSELWRVLDKIELQRTQTSAYDESAASTKRRVA